MVPAHPMLGLLHSYVIGALSSDPRQSSFISLSPKPSTERCFLHALPQRRTLRLGQEARRSATHKFNSTKTTPYLRALSNITKIGEEKV